MRKKVLLLINGSAGPGDIGIDTYAIIEKFARAGWEPTVFPILPSSGMGAEDLIEEYAAQSELVVCAGGDGTLNHAITALMKLEHPPRLGYLPAGSTNDFAKGVNIPTNLDDACDAILNGRPFSYDIGCFNEKCFNYVAAFGAFSAISYTTHQSFKNVLGHAAYVLHAIGTMPKHLNYRCHMRIEADTFTAENDYLFGAIFNATSIGGIDVPGSDDVKLDDGKFEMILIKAPSNSFEVPLILHDLMNAKFNNNKFIEYHHLSQVKVCSDENTSWTLDGEFGGKTESAEISVAKQAITIMVPKQLT